MSLIANLQDTNLWVPVWSGNFEAQPVPNTTNRVYPIGTIGIPVLVSSQVIGLYVGSNNSPPNWKYAGMLRQVVPTGLIVGGLANAQFSQHKVYLNRINVIDLPKCTTESALYLDVPYWIPDISLNLFEFTGSVIDRNIPDIRKVLKLVVLKKESLFLEADGFVENYSRIANSMGLTISVRTGGIYVSLTNSYTPNGSIRVTANASFSTPNFYSGPISWKNTSTANTLRVDITEYGFESYLE
ncbi:MAG: hypothetical protein HC836_24755 [Richelia sp. RM2_1_2]|nr:hypothetical protein [Richelia sp. RM1_1_1]NJO61346.1 hypothetical protein [Richelia sp. RM2_1_2]